VLSALLVLVTLLAPPAGFYRTGATDAPPPALANEARPNDANVEAQLEAARRKLDEAAREVAELSAQLSSPFVEKFSTFAGLFGRAIIGVQLDPASGKDGARVLSVSPGGPASEAGMRAGDVIVAVNGTEVKGADASRQVTKILRDVKPDDKLNVHVLRDGKTRDFTVTARPGPGVMAFDHAIPPQMPDMPPLPHLNSMFMVQGPLSNMELATLTPQLGKYFGTDKGVLVVRAPPDGVLKLEDGDVILAIDGREPTSGSHATRILGSYQPGEKITLRIVRQHKTVDLETSVPAEWAGSHRNIILRGGGPATAPAPGRVIIMNREEDAI
jgi:predicted metalloprotease with PDZ domain